MITHDLGGILYVRGYDFSIQMVVIYSTYRYIIPANDPKILPWLLG
jgi:hypothetical protein